MMRIVNSVNYTQPALGFTALSRIWVDTLADPRAGASETPAI